MDKDNMQQWRIVKHGKRGHRKPARTTSVPPIPARVEQTKSNEEPSSGVCPDIVQTPLPQVLTPTTQTPTAQIMTPPSQLYTLLGDAIMLPPINTSQKRDGLMSYRPLPKHIVYGFIVNVHDAVNYDISLVLTAELRDVYSNVIYHPFSYRDFAVSEGSVTNSEVREDIAYRCRLQGVDIRRQNPANISGMSRSTNPTEMEIMISELHKLINRTNGWVVCTISDIDVYRRLLVDVVVPTQDHAVNIRKFLLNRPELFQRYPRKRF